MIGLLQRVSQASVTVNEETTGRIDTGLLVLVGFERNDEPGRLDRFVQRLLDYRVFPDEQDRMNRSLRTIGGGLLLVPQFTLAADTRTGNRPSFSPAATPEEGRLLFQELCRRASREWPNTASGVFGADMKVHLTNDGPVTFWLQV